MYTGDRRGGDGKMSIIQEALKKAQGDYFEKKTPQAGESVKYTGSSASEETVFKPRVKIQAIRRTRRTTSMRLPVLTGILVTLILIYGIRFSLQYSGRHEIKTPHKVVSTPASTGPAGTAPAKEPVSTPAPLFALNGIMYVEGRAQAIINGYVLEEGDKINGATILTIERDYVLLNFNDADMKLDIRR